MEINVLLYWLGSLSVGVQAVMALRWRQWLAAAWFGALTALLVAVHLLVEPYPATLALVLWVVFLILPMRLGRVLGRAFARSDLAAARRWLTLRGLLLPFQPTRLLLRQVRAAERYERGDVAGGAALLTPRPGMDATTARILELVRARLEARFEQVGAAFGDALPPDLAPAVAEARAETGDLVAGLTLMAVAVRDPRSDGLQRILALAGLWALAGEGERLEALLAGPLARQPEDRKRFWRATAARRAGGDRAPYLETMVALSDRAASHVLRAHARRRLMAPILAPLPGDAVAARVQLAIEHLAMALGVAAAAPGDPPGAEPGHAGAKGAPIGGPLGGRGAGSRQAGVFTRGGLWAIPAVVIVNLAVYAYGAATGAEPALSATTRYDDSIARLRDLGMVTYPTVLRSGEWWRVLASTVLHVNYLHILMNTIGFLVLGGLVERRLGAWRTVVLVTVAGCGTMLFGIARVHYVTPLSDLLASPEAFARQYRSLLGMLGASVDSPLGAFPPAFLEQRGVLMDFLGASGGVLGLVGAMVPIALADLARGRGQEARQMLTLVALILAMQTAFDLVELQGSSPLHLSGALIGMVMGAILVPPGQLGVARRLTVLGLAGAAAALLMVAPRLLG